MQQLECSPHSIYIYLSTIRKSTKAISSLLPLMFYWTKPLLVISQNDQGANNKEGHHNNMEIPWVQTSYKVTQLVVFFRAIGYT